MTKIHKKTRPIGFQFSPMGLFWIVGGVLVDQGTKLLATTSQVLPLTYGPYLNIVLVYNRGISFGFLAGYNRVFIPLVLLLVSVIVALGVFICYLRSQDILSRLGFGLIMSGALGNIVDRLRVGYVVDFLDFHYKTWHFPVFNIADTLITLGAITLTCRTLFDYRKN